MPISTLINTDLVKNIITNNGEEGSVPYRWTHGANDVEMGDGLLVYSFIQFIRAKTCVCIGSGGGFIPRIMTQSRKDMWEMGVFGGNPDVSWGDIGCTYVVDANNGIGGKSDIGDEESFFRKHFHPRVILETSERAFYDFFIRQGIRIDYLHIDGDHSYEGVKRDFELYSTIMNPNGIISIHDTDSEYQSTFIVTDDEKNNFHSFDGPVKFIEELRNNSEWDLVNLKNFRIFTPKVSSTGLTILTKR
jgi:hypothetical protein